MDWEISPQLGVSIVPNSFAYYNGLVIAKGCSKLSLIRVLSKNFCLGEGEAEIMRCTIT